MNYNYLTMANEEKHEEVKKRIAKYREAGQMLPIITEVLKKFDGKVFNCRLEKALQEATGNRIFCKNEYGRSICIYYYFCSYTITLASLPIEKALTDNKRINAAALIEDAQQRSKNFFVRACRIETQEPQVEEIKKRIEQLQKAVEALMNPLDYDLREIYGLHYSLRNS